MPSQPTRFLHLSDFHVGKDHWAQTRLFDKITQHVERVVVEAGAPDIVILTGDIANRGQKSEYEAFRREFFLPLQDALGGATWSGRVFAVPGNHDIARPSPDVLDRVAAVAPGAKFFDPTREGRTARDQVIPRLKTYRQSAHSHVNGSWITSNEGTFTEVLTVHGSKLAVVGLNTAWLSMNDADRGHLSPGVALVEAALERIDPLIPKIVIGHHPLNWFREEDATRIRALFGHHGVIYLHGHLHKPEGRADEGAGLGFLSFQAGAAFQARDEEPWRNGLTWGEIDTVRAEIVDVPGSGVSPSARQGA